MPQSHRNPPTIHLIVGIRKARACVSDDHVHPPPRRPKLVKSARDFSSVCALGVLWMYPGICPDMTDANQVWYRVPQSVYHTAGVPTLRPSG